MSTPARVSEQITVPFLDLRLAHAHLKDELLAEIATLIDSAAFTNGRQVAEFETAFARYCGTDRCVGLASGLDALRLAFLAAGIEPGDEVLVPANTFVASFEAITQAGGVPVPVDVTEKDYNVDVDALAASLSDRTRFVLPVHLYGQLADMRGIMDVAEQHSLMVVEDACQAHGAERDGCRPGDRSLAAAFSFYPGKNLGAVGDAGALVTNDEGLDRTVRALREHGQVAKYHHELEGYTARLDTVQAIALLLKLPHLDRGNDQRRTIATRYAEALEGVGDLTLHPVAPRSRPVWHLYTIRTSDPEALAATLGERGIGTGRHYPVPAHLTRAYEWLGLRRGEFPVSERLSDELLSLPIFPGMTEAQQDAVIAAVEDFFRRG